MVNSVRRLLCTTALAAGFLPAAAAAASSYRLQSDTVVRVFEQTKVDGDEVTGVPGYEYLRLDLGALGEPGVSAHLYGWGRYDFGDWFEDDAAGEVLYGYVQYAGGANQLLLRAGRQAVFEGVADDTVDGLRVAGEVTPWFAVSLYGGLPVSVETSAGRSGDRLYGGRVAHHLGSYYEVGASYQRTDDDGEKQAEIAGVDLSLTPPGPLSLAGKSVRNLITDGWTEHDYRARLKAGQLEVKPSFQRFDYQAYFDDEQTVPQVFRFLRDSDEVVTVLGGDVNWGAASPLEVSARIKHYDYRQADETALYYGGLVTWHPGGPSQLGAEAGRMNGDQDDNRYTLCRAFAYGANGPILASGDVVYVIYDDAIAGEDTSLLASLSAGTRLFSDALELAVTGAYSADPYFDEDYRATLTVTYSLGSK